MLNLDDEQVLPADDADETTAVNDQITDATD